MCFPLSHGQPPFSKVMRKKMYAPFNRQIWTLTPPPPQKKNLLDRFCWVFSKEERIYYMSGFGGFFLCFRGKRTEMAVGRGGPELHVPLSCLGCTKTRPYPQNGWGFPEAIPEKFWQDPLGRDSLIFCVLGQEEGHCERGVLTLFTN